MRSRRKRREGEEEKDEQREVSLSYPVQPKKANKNIETRDHEHRERLMELVSRLSHTRTRARFGFSCHSFSHLKAAVLLSSLGPNVGALTAVLSPTPRMTAL